MSGRGRGQWGYEGCNTRGRGGGGGYPNRGQPRGGYNNQGYNNQGYNSQGYNNQGYNNQGYNNQGYNNEGYNNEGYNNEGYNKEGYNNEGYNNEGWNNEGWNNQGWNDEGWGSQGWDQQWSEYDESYSNNWQGYGPSQDYNDGSRYGYGPPPGPGPMYHGMRGNGRGPISRKRPFTGPYPPRGRPYKRGPNMHGPQHDYNDWGGNGYDGWEPRGPSGPGWGPGGDYYEENPYEQSFKHQGGYEAPYKPPKQQQDQQGPQSKKAKKELEEHHKQWSKKHESPEDKLIKRKHEILTTIEEKNNLNDTIQSIMNAMKCASETLSMEARSAAEVSECRIKQDMGEENMGGVTADAAEAKPAAVLPPRVLIGVIRVGPAKRKLIINGAAGHGDELVAVFKDKPTKEMLHRLASLIEFKLKGPVADKAIVSPNDSAEIITVSLDKFYCRYPVLISLTSPACSGNTDQKSAKDNDNATVSMTTESDDTRPQEDDADLLSEENCQTALRKIRRTKWARKKREELELPVVGMFVDFAQRLDGWRHMTPYAAEVLVHAVMTKLAKDVRESELSVWRLFIQCIEVMAMGLVLEDGPGLKDPCESGSVDVFANLTTQDAENLTRAAQAALRMCACGRIEDLLELEAEDDTQDEAAQDA